MSLLVQGRRHLLVSDIPNAIAALAESSQLLGEHYGDLADECAESYYYYGIALLEMARLDPDVLGDAVEGGNATQSLGELSCNPTENLPQARKVMTKAEKMKKMKVKMRKPVMKKKKKAHQKALKLRMLR